MSEVSNLIQTKLQEVPAGKPGSTQKKMIVFISAEDSKKLGALAAVTATGKIDLGSQLLKLSIADACAAAQKAGKLDEKGEVVGVKKKDDKAATTPPAGAPPAPPAAK